MTAVKGRGGHLTELGVTLADRTPGDKWREEIQGLNNVMACQRNSHKKMGVEGMRCSDNAAIDGAPSVDPGALRCCCKSFRVRLSCD